MRKDTITVLTAASMMLAACQSGSFKISGSGEKLVDGDTVIMARANSEWQPVDTAVVKDGKFEFEGKADSTRFCIVFSTKDREAQLPFFVEGGNIRLYMADSPLTMEVGGTTMNNKWQDFVDETAGIGLDINRLASRLYDTKADHQARQEIMDSITELNKMFEEILISKATKNIDNEFGAFLLTYYNRFINRDKRHELEQKMPGELRKKTF